MNTTKLFTPIEIEHLSSLRYINSIDEHMRIVSSIRVPADADQQVNPVLLVLDIFIDDRQIDRMGFNLYNYSYAELIDLAQHIGDNDTIMRAVDTALAGDTE